MLNLSNNKRDYSKKLIIKELFFGKEFTSTDLSEKIDKSIPLTTQYLNELIEENYLVENGLANSTGGRRPQVYALKKDIFYIISVAMDQLITRIALISNSNEVVGIISKIDLPLVNNPKSLEQLQHHLEMFIENSKVPKEKIIGIGIGMPGFIDAKKGINHTFLHSKDGSIVTTLQNALNIPVMIENDSSLIALAELKWGVAQGKQNVMVINIGWGVGLGIIINGKLFRGHDGFAGEFSHIPLFENNKLCSCGKYGCLETETSMVVATQRAIKAMSENRPSILHSLSSDHIEESARMLINAAQKGDKFSIEIMSESAYNIGRGVAILIHLLNPELVVISGIGSLAGKMWIAPIQQAINEHCIPKIAEHTEIEISNLGYRAEITGACALVMEHLEEIRSLQKVSNSIAI